MENNLTMIPNNPKTYKTYPKNEQIKGYRASLSQQEKKEAHVVHRMGMDYNLNGCSLNQIPANRLFKPLEKLKIIYSFSIYLFQLNQQDIVSRNFFVKLKPLSSLQTVNIQISHGGWLSLQGMKRFSHALAELKRVSKLTLSLHSCWELNDECFYILFQGLKKHRNLRYLDLNLCNCRKMTEKTFKALALTLKYSLKSLEEFSFAISHCTFTKGKPLDFLDSGLKNLIHLKKLKIYLGAVKISPETDCHVYLSSLQHLKSLRILDLNMSSLHNSATTFKRLATSFKYLTNLRTLSLDLEYNETCFVQEMDILAQSFQYIPSLENLTLDFSSCFCLNDQAVEKLADGLRILTKLSEINLLFDHCRQVGEVGVESVIGVLETLSNLNSISLSFRDCGPIRADLKNRLEMNQGNKKISFVFGRSEYAS